MSSDRGVTYALDFAEGRSRRKKGVNAESAVASAIPRLARLMALAIRFERLVGEQKMRNYAEISRLGHVTRGRMTQIMKLRLLAPDIQEQILFLPETRGLNERNLRVVVKQINWNEQRQMFEKLKKEQCC